MAVTGGSRARVEVEGLEQALSKLGTIGRTIARNQTKGIMLDAIEPIRVAVKAAAPVGPTGNLKRSIQKQIWEHDKRRNRIDAEVYSKRPEGAHAHLVEFGHRIVTGGKLGKGGRVVGSVPPHPFMRPAYDQTKDLATRIANDKIGDLIKREWSR